MDEEFYAFWNTVNVPEWMDEYVGCLRICVVLKSVLLCQGAGLLQETGFK